MTNKVKESHLLPQLAFAEEWQEIWQKFIEKSQQSFMDFHSGTALPSSEADEGIVTIFDPEVVAETLQKAMVEFSQQPEKIMELQNKHLKDVMQLVEAVGKKINGEKVEPMMAVDSRDKRFKNPLWQNNATFFFMQQLYLLNANLLREMLGNLSGLDNKTTHKLEFYTRHLIDAMAPTNFPMTNPDVLKETFATKGENLVQGFRNFLRDSTDGHLNIKMIDMQSLKLGEDIATAKGKVIFRNDLFELICYEPTTEKVAKIPLLIIPPWINKFYIFDLKPENSFIRWAVDSGLTVYIISWVNPDKRHANKTLTDYVMEGAKTALDHVRERHKLPQINVMGYCTGGVLLNCLLSHLASKGEKPVKSATLIAAPIDFKEAGDLLVYVCEQQLSKLEKHVHKKGYLEGEALIKSFNLLRANDLIWSFYINNYFMGKEPVPFDMLYWNNDAARMPAKMHLGFLRNMYLENKLIQPGGINVGGVPVDLSNITVPMFTMAAYDDHIAPWRAVYPLMTKVHSSKKKFVLSGSGHVAGVFNHPQRDKYHFWDNNQIENSAEQWLAGAVKHQGSWWPSWYEWLQAYSGPMVKPLAIKSDEVLGDAPGKYVFG